jgi:hypothetical protein
LNFWYGALRGLLLQEVEGAAVCTGQERDPLLQAPHGQLPRHGQLLF